MRCTLSMRAGLLCLSLLMTLAVTDRAAAQVDPAIRDRAVSAAVQIALTVDVTASGSTAPQVFPVGSGTVVSPDGLVLTNWHVMDMAAHRARFAAWEQEAEAAGALASFHLNERSVLILTSSTGGRPRPAYLAEIVASDERLDLAVLQVVALLDGPSANPSVSTLPYVPIGNSDAVSLADPIDIYSYPRAGGGSLTYTTGVVSGFNFDDFTERRAWITTDATLSGGSSGGSAVNRQGQLVGVPTQGSALDCRPFDTNGDGLLNGQDLGCIPVGGSIGQIRPINLAWPLLEEAGLSLDAAEPRDGLSKSGFLEPARPGSPPQD